MAEYLQTNIYYLGMPCKSGTLHCNFKTGKRIQRLFFFFKTCAVFALFVYFLPSPFFFFFGVWLNHYFPLIVSERKKREEACACTYGRCMLVTQWEVSFSESVFHGIQFSLICESEIPPKTNNKILKSAHTCWSSQGLLQPSQGPIANPKHFCSTRPPVAPESLRAPIL